MNTLTDDIKQGFIEELAQLGVIVTPECASKVWTSVNLDYDGIDTYLIDTTVGEKTISVIQQEGQPMLYEVYPA